MRGYCCLVLHAQVASLLFKTLFFDQFLWSIFVAAFFLQKNHGSTWLDFRSFLIVGINLSRIKYGDAKKLQKLEYLYKYFWHSLIRGNYINQKSKIFYTINKGVIYLQLWRNFWSQIDSIIHDISRIGGISFCAIWFAERGGISSQSLGCFCWILFFVGNTCCIQKSSQRCDQ